MSWALFCQIEVILLTIGIVISFVVSMHQTTKDNSFFKRFGAISKVISDSITSGLSGYLKSKENGNNDK